MSHPDPTKEYLMPCDRCAKEVENFYEEDGGHILCAPCRETLAALGKKRALQGHSR